MTATDEELKKRLKFALSAAADAAPGIMASYQSQKLKAHRKKDGSWVTSADRDAERQMRRALRQKYPGDSIIGEEFSERKGTNEWTWFLDPIDGTESFVRGVPLFGTMLGLERNGQAVLGVVHFPALNETVVAARGQGAWWRPSGKKRFLRARVSGVSRLDKAMISTTSAANFKKAGWPRLHEELVRGSGNDRGWGDCYGHILVATGRADAMFDPLMHDWDCVALKPIVEEAGGTFTDFHGNPTAKGKSAISTNGRLRPVILKSVQKMSIRRNF
ncbi:MAG: histidinol phosphate phosphatase [Elusimicrobia bacterium]|nr:histidinol phosphate phosphatase [Elusimicrobiota bacterium]